MSRRADRPADPCIVVIFGAAGDLTRRKLLPALSNLRRLGLLSQSIALVGVARRPGDDESFRAEMTTAVESLAPGETDSASWDGFRERLHYLEGELTDARTYAALAERLRSIDSEHGTGGNVLFYLATPPEVFAPIVRHLGESGLSREDAGSWRRVVIEKPFGYDLDSARALNGEVGAVLAERQIFRIDHYLGKETVQNILVLRFANGIFEPIWNRRYIDHVQVMVAESIGVEGRGSYYEGAGALRDMVQNHMFQLLALVAMEPPVSFDADRVRDERVKVLEAIRPMTPEQVAERTVRGQYGPGTIHGGPVPGYREEPNVAPDSTVETYSAVKLDVENWRWADVPFYLRTGKRLPRRDTEIVVQFKRPPLLLFPESAASQIEPNRLVLHIQPDEGLTLEIQAKRPGPTLRLESVSLDFSYADFGRKEPATGYERLLYDAMVGDSTLYHRADMVDAAWSIATPILEAWRDQPAPTFPSYAAGSWGPVAADELLARDGRAWWSSKPLEE